MSLQSFTTTSFAMARMVSATAEESTDLACSRNWVFL